MSQTLLLMKLLLVHCAAQHPAKIHASCYTDVSLQCPGVDFGTLDFIFIAWYKINMTSKPKQGIVRHNKGRDTQYYHFPRPASFGGEHSLFLPSVRTNDSGRYECYISATVGKQNLNLQVDLTVDECVSRVESTTATDVLNVTLSTRCCEKQVEDLPVVWSIGGYVVVALTKIILSLISIWLIRAVLRRTSRRRQQQKWGR